MKKLLYFLFVIFFILTIFSSCYSPFKKWPEGKWVSEDGFICFQFMIDKPEKDFNKIDFSGEESTYISFSVDYGTIFIIMLWDSYDFNDELISGIYKYNAKHQILTLIVERSKVGYYPVGTEIVLHKIEEE